MQFYVTPPFIIHAILPESISFLLLNNKEFKTCTITDKTEYNCQIAPSLGYAFTPILYRFLMYIIPCEFVHGIQYSLNKESQNAGDGINNCARLEFTTAINSELNGFYFYFNSDETKKVTLGTSFGKSYSRTLSGNDLSNGVQSTITLDNGSKKYTITGFSFYFVQNELISDVDVSDFLLEKNKGI